MGLRGMSRSRSPFGPSLIELFRSWVQLSRREVKNSTMAVPESKSLLSKMDRQLENGALTEKRGRQARGMYLDT